MLVLHYRFLYIYINLCYKIVYVDRYLEVNEGEYNIRCDKNKDRQITDEEWE